MNRALLGAAVAGAAIILSGCPPVPPGGGGGSTTTTTTTTSTSTTSTTVAPTTTTSTTVAPAPSGWARLVGGPCTKVDPQDPTATVPTTDCADIAYAITADTSGNVGLTGQHSATIDFGNGPLVHDVPGYATQQTYNAFVGRFAPTGQAIWSRTIGAEANDSGRAVAAAANGDLVVGGSVSNYVDFGDGQLTSTGAGGDAFIARYAAANGALVFKKRYGANGADVTRGVAVDLANNTVATGWFQDRIDTQETPGNFNDDILATGGPTDQDIFVTKYGPTGTLAWAKKFGTGNFDYAYGVGTDRAGNVYISGSFAGSIQFGTTPQLNSAGAYDAYVVRLSAATGTPEWAMRFGGPEDDVATAITIDDPDDGVDNANVIVAGTFRNAVTFPTAPTQARTAAGQEDAFVARVGIAGAMKSLLTVGGPSKDAPTAVALDSGGRVFVTGQFSGSASLGGAAFAASGVDAFVASYSLPTAGTGTHNWSRQYGGLGNQLGYDVASTSSGRVLFGGAAERTTNFGYGALTSVGLSDIAFASLSSPPA